MILHESVVIVKHVISKSMMFQRVKLTLYFVKNGISHMTFMSLKWARLLANRLLKKPQ